MTQVPEPAAQQRLRLSHSVAGDSPRTRLRPAHAATAAPAAALLTDMLLPAAPQGPGTGQSTELAVAWAGGSQSASGAPRTPSRDAVPVPRHASGPAVGPSSPQIRGALSLTPAATALLALVPGLGLTPCPTRPPTHQPQHPLPWAWGSPMARLCQKHSLSWNHTIIKVGKTLRDHQVQVLPQHCQGHPRVPKCRIHVARAQGHVIRCRGTNGSGPALSI